MKNFGPLKDEGNKSVYQFCNKYIITMVGEIKTNYAVSELLTAYILCNFSEHLDPFTF